MICLIIILITVIIKTNIADRLFKYNITFSIILTSCSLKSSSFTPSVWASTFGNGFLLKKF